LLRQWVERGLKQRKEIILRRSYLTSLFFKRTQFSLLNLEESRRTEKEIMKIINNKYSLSDAWGSSAVHQLSYLHLTFANLTAF
jgi:hypothetical protein